MSDYAFSQWYPYYNTQSSYTDNSQVATLLRKIVDYIIDAPRVGYNPPDDNTFSRCRLWKYLYHDGEKPLEQPLPTIAQKMQVVFDAEKPTESPTEKGYRLFPQIWAKPSQTVGETRIYVYLGREIPTDDFKTAIGVHFLIWTHYQYGTNTKAREYDRALGIEQALIEAFNGVSMDGIGTFHFNRHTHPDCQGRVVYDQETNIGRELVLGLELATTALNDMEQFNNMPNFSKNGKIKLG